MWSMVAQRLTQNTSPAATPDQRGEAAWSAVPQEHIQSFFEGMPRHVAASLDSLNQEIVQVFLSSQSDGNLSEDPVIAARWSHQCHYSMVLMRRLLIDAQGKFRKMMSDNQALASRIDQDIQSAHLQVSALRAELADTNQRIKDICSESMAGNVITTCMPPTSTTNTTTVISTAEGHWLKDTKQGNPGAESTVKVSKVCSSPPIADKGGTKSPVDLSESSTQRSVQSPKSVVSQHQKSGEQKTNLFNGSSQDQSAKGSTELETIRKEQNNLDKANDDAFSGVKHFPHDVSERPQVPPKQVGLASKGSRDLTTKEVKEKTENSTENSKPSEEMPVSKHKSHRRERRSLKGSDIQKSVLEDLKSQQSNNSKTDDSKSELQRSESDGNQNSAPECDLSISGSPFKEDISKLASEDSVLCSSSSLKSSPRKKESVDDGSKREDFSMDFHRSSPPVKDESNAQCFPLLKDSSVVFLQKDSTNGHRYKAKTKSDPLDKRRDKCAQEFSVLSSPSSVMRHKTGVSKLQLGICSWENRQFELKEPWYKTQDNSSSMSGKSLMSESSSKEETSDSQDGLPPDFCDQRPIRDENKGGRFVVFDSKNNREPFRDWRTTLSESYRDQQASDSWKSGSCTTVEQKETKIVDDKRQAPEKDQNISGLIQESSYYRKPENLEYSPYNSEYCFLFCYHMIS
ncbi:hypothetical protein TNCV_4968481 [Trichonephila clavipes]|nr:hypothetical protein TNCV_4968481 [Trichonephila clavipes]